MAEKYAFLDAKHPVWEANVDRWEQNERRLRGGDYVIGELRRFLWETSVGESVPEGSTLSAGEHYLARQRAATYINFPEMFTLAIKGHMQRQRPQPENGLSFGALGLVPRERNFAKPSQAELVYYNTDGVGNDGSQWDNFWLSAWERGAATGHRWMFAEAPAAPAQTRARELAGFRPYLVEWAPQQVTNWEFALGRLTWMIVRIPTERRKVDSNGVWVNPSDKPGYLLLVREGEDALGSEFVGGGWWKFTSDRDLIPGAAGHGAWEKTDGEIPCSPLFYERDNGVAGKEKGQPNISRPGTTELGQAAVAYMNLSSAAEYDAWDAASSVKFLMGADENAYNVAAAKWNAGEQIVPVPATAAGTIPQLQDGSSGAVVASVFETHLARLQRLAEKIAVQEATSSPDSSGLSKQMGFGELKAPRLANVASELESCQNVMIYFLEKRFGYAQPKGSVVWTREFDVGDVVADITEFFALEKMSGMRSPTLGAKLMVQAASERGYITDNSEQATIKKEYEDAAAKAQAQSDALASLAGEFAGGGGGGGNTGNAPPPPAVDA